MLVTGKGGTGKTSLSVALARAAAAKGRKVLIAEVDNHHPALTEYFGVEPVFEPGAVAENLYIANIKWLSALEAWLSGVMPVKRVVRLILNNRLVKIFLDVSPGSRELSVIGRIIALSRKYDLLVVDMPASGHALSFFRVPYKSMSLFPTGPIKRLCIEAIDTFEDDSCVVVIASLPEEMVVNETIETYRALKQLSPEIDIPLVVLNQSIVPSMSEHEKDLLDRMATELAERYPLGRGSCSSAMEMVQAGRWEAERESTTAEAVNSISTKTGAYVLPVPLMTGVEDQDQVAVRIESLLKRHMEEELFQRERAL